MHMREVVTMLKMENFFMIRDLHHQGLKISQISRKTGFHRNTVRKYVTAQTSPVPKKRRQRSSKLDPFKDYIQQRINEYSLCATRILREIQEQGFTGHYTIVNDYIKQIRPHEGTLAVLRYETKPGIQAQVDWGECYHIDEDGHLRKVYCFSIVLGYSRMRYVEFTISTDVYTFIQCHNHAFAYFGGYTQEILYDNIKQIIIERAMKPKDHTWNAKFDDFFSYCGFTPRLCKPYNPQTKGKIENSIGYVKRDFLLGGTFSSLSDMNRQSMHWLNRVNNAVHGTTKEIPVERLKQENLKTLKGVQPYQVRREEHRKISNDSYVSYRGNRYSVPYQFAGRAAILEVDETRIIIRVGSEVICSHDIVPGHCRAIRKKEHFAGLLPLAMKCNSERMKQHKPLFKMSGPEVVNRPLSVYDSFSGGVQ
jgi:transposase